MEEIKKIIAQTFNCEQKSIKENSGPDTIEEWDSLGHFNLINNIEEYYGVMLSTNDIFKIKSVKDISIILDNYNLSNSED